MLSRVAESLFWMSRHTERAENIARLVHVNAQLMLDLPSSQARQLAKDWRPLVACLGDEKTFSKRQLKGDSASVIEFLVFDRDNANSIASCLRNARENARTVREHISTDMWEQTNRTHLWFLSKSARQSFERNQYDFFQRIIKTLQLFQGITDTTMIHGEGWDFIQISKYLERADKTTRVLDDEYHMLKPNATAPGEDLLQWLAVLRSCSARHSYQRLYASTVTPEKVSELLLLNENLPRSVQFCLLHVDQSLRRVSGVGPGRFSNRAEKLSSRLLAELAYGTLEDICPRGLHEAADTLQTRLNQIGEAIRQTYLHHPAPPCSETPPPEQNQ